MFVALTWLSLFLAAGDVARSRDLLRDAGFRPDASGALAYLQSWLPDPQRQARLRGYLAQLGDDDFDRREEASRQLRQAGPAVLADLRRAADSSDPEVRRRARDLLEQVDREPGELVIAACRLLRDAKLPQADAVLLRFAPFAPDEASEAVLLETVGHLGLTPAVRAALTDAQPLTRRAAVCALGAAGEPARLLLLTALTDPDRAVRCEAGRSLARLGERAGLPALVEALARGTPTLAGRAEETLWRIAREQAPPILLRGGKDREPCRLGWETWLKEHGNTVDPRRFLLDEQPRGWIVVADDASIGQSPGSVRILDLKGKLVRLIEKLESPADVQLLAGDRLLIAEHWSNRVTERDLQGRVLWEHKLLDKPVVALRLLDGGTLMASYAEIREVARDGTVRYSFQPDKGMIYGLVKLPNGHLLFITGAGAICEADRRGTILREFKPEKYSEGASYWAGIELLAPGRYLLALSGSDRVVEVNDQGKILWEAEIGKPTYASRLADGTTLVACVDDRKVVVLNSKGKAIQTVVIPGRPFRTRRY